MKPSWIEYFLGIAEAASVRSSCERSKVGAVISDRNNRVVAVGYNDAPSGMPGCETCPRRTSNVESGSSYDTGPGKCVSLHAEQNCVLHARREDMAGGTIWITRPPCDGCLKMLMGTDLSAAQWPNGFAYLKGDLAGVPCDTNIWHP